MRVLDLDMKLSPHFRLRELVVTQHRQVDNTPPPEVVDRLYDLCCSFLEPVRRQFGPLRVTSGYRCLALNAAIRGSRYSAHLYGCAADFVHDRGKCSTTEIVQWIVERSALPYDQVIDEHSSTASWVHLGMNRPGKVGDRGQALTMRLGKFTKFSV